MRQINNEYAALVMIEILYEKELINKATYDNIKNNYQLSKTANREEKSA